VPLPGLSGRRRRGSRCASSRTAAGPTPWPTRPGPAPWRRRPAPRADVPNASATGATLNNLSQQVLPPPALRSGGGATFPTPFGSRVQAVWSRPLCAPAPLVLHVKSAKEKDSWF